MLNKRNYSWFVKTQLSKFNKHFASISSELYGEQYAVKYDIITNSKRQRLYKFSSNDAEDDIPKIVPKEAREISAFFSLVIDETMDKLPTPLTSTGIRCFRKRCTGIISSEVDLDNNEIHWKCSKCRYQGTITGW